MQSLRAGVSADSAPIDPGILDEAAVWLMQLHAGNVTDADRQAFERWRQSSPQHGLAWSRAERLMNKLGGLPARLAMPALSHSVTQPVNPGRRVALGKLALLLVAAPAGWSAWQHTPWREWSADHHTAIGERRDIVLADGSRITLNTATAVNVYFDDTQRRIALFDGEILIQTATDTVQQRPFLVSTKEGQLHALGTRFNVRQLEGRTQVAVLEGAVAVQPKDGPVMSGTTGEHVLQAGQQTIFSRSSVDASTTVDVNATAWTKGMLRADKMRLADFAAELARYRRGGVHCDPAVAGLRISGAFPVQDSQRTLAMLQSTYPLRASVLPRRFWYSSVMLEPR